MMRVLLLLLLGFLADTTADNKTLEGYSVYRLLPANDAQLEWLHNLRGDPELDFWSLNDVMVSPEHQKYFLDQLELQDIHSETIVADVQMTIDAERMRQRSAQRDDPRRGVSFTKYNRYDEIRAYLAQLATNFPDVVTVGSIGTSSEGREIPIVMISTGGGGSRPVVLVDAGIHAREWLSVAMALYIAQQLLENTRNADLIANVDWHIIPVLNPDGYEYSHTTKRLWRKTRSITNCSACDPRRGVDAVMNFGLPWMKVGGSSKPCAETYAGPHSFSEPETAALRDHVTAQSAISLYLNFHSGGNLMVYPWDSTKDLPDDWRDLDELAREADAAQIAAGGKPYYTGSDSNFLSSLFTTNIDWMKSVGGVRLSYLISLPGGGKDGFDVPGNEIANTLSTFWPAVRVFGEYVAASYP